MEMWKGSIGEGGREQFASYPPVADGVLIMGVQQGALSPVLFEAASFVLFFVQAHYLCYNYPFEPLRLLSLQKSELKDPPTSVFGLLLAWHHAQPHAKHCISKNKTNLIYFHAYPHTCKFHKSHHLELQVQ